MIRTGAASGVATRYMTAPDASVLAVFGVGIQAKGQILAVAAVRDLTEIRVFNRDAARRERFIADIAPLVTGRVVAAASAAEALDGAQIVCTATSSATPVFDGNAVSPGTHINAVGSNSLLRRELDETVFRRASFVVVDSRAQAPLECGDLLIPVEQGVFLWDALPELGDLVSGKLTWQRGAGDITVFESQGIGLEDVTVAWHVSQIARSRGVGVEVDLLP
jgi:ornithine cyclodeaminase/alanine dehydrogenase-like protein (mu-crystallin family)